MVEAIASMLGLPLDGAHLEEALTHPSYRNERPGACDNQRLEFLGDAVLGFCVSEILWDMFPQADEGALTRMRARLVNAEALAAWARNNEIAKILKLGRGAATSGLANSTNVLADAVEALIAAAYLDGGLGAARQACRAVVGPGLDRLDGVDQRDPKSRLQERVQALGMPPPVYQVTESGGVAHDPWFAVVVTVGDEPIAEGRGRSKRLAERDAAERALAREAELVKPSGGGEP